jgi:predicted RND superfamily exporter protein
MRNLLADMLTAVTTAAVFILVVLVVTLRSWRFFSLALIPAITPIVGAIAVMGLLGITLRIGTAMILAIALGLVVDDTIYYLHRLQVETKRGRSPVDAVHQMFARDARSGLLSSLVLITGFATMSINEVSSIRDMGIVAALTMLIAVTADLLFDPAQFLLVSRRRRGSMSAVPTPPVAEPADASL